MSQPQVKLLPGLVFFVAQIVLVLLGIAVGISGFMYAVPYFLLLLVPFAILVMVIESGLIKNGPNQAVVLQLFGTYKGTLTDIGYFWGNPLFQKTKVSLKVQTFETGQPSGDGAAKDGHGRRIPTKVNDKDGTPIEIAAVITYSVESASNAIFNVDDYEQFIHIQADAALRNLASHYRYDAQANEEFSLRGHIDEVAEKLKHELQQRLTEAGLKVLSAQISSLAYAPEIAGAMLQRQQAAALLGARQLIVDGAVGLVEHTLAELSRKQVVELDTKAKAALVSNLLIVLCSHQAPVPVLGTGSSAS